VGTEGFHGGSSMKLGVDSRVPPSMCLDCGRINDAATGVDHAEGPDAAPQPGDVTVCFYCGHIMVFGDDLMLRNPTDAEIREIAGDARILAVQRARRLAQRRREQSGREQSESGES
jgi:hypothetical protein